MRKYLPAIVFSIGFCGFIIAQVLSDHLFAEQSAGDKKLVQQYESIFNKVNFRTTNHENISLGAIKAPVIIVNFWASWCAPCIEEFPSLANLRSLYSKNDLEIIGVNTDDTNQMSVIRKIKEKFKLDFPMVADSNSQLVEKFMISSIPTTIVFSAGKVIEISRGNSDFDDKDFVNKLNAAIKENSKKKVGNASEGNNRSVFQLFSFYQEKKKS